MSCGDAVIFWVTRDTRERVFGPLLVVHFEEQPIKIQKLYFTHDKLRLPLWEKKWIFTFVSSQYRPKSATVASDGSPVGSLLLEEKDLQLQTLN